MLRLLRRLWLRTRTTGTITGIIGTTTRPGITPAGGKIASDSALKRLGARKAYRLTVSSRPSSRMSFRGSYGEQ